MKLLCAKYFLKPTLIFKKYFVKKARHLFKNASFVGFQYITANTNLFIVPFMISLTILCIQITRACLRHSGNVDDFKEVLKSLHEKLLNVSLYP